MSPTAVPASSATSIVPADVCAVPVVNSTISMESASVSVDLTEGVSDMAGVNSEGHLLANALAVIQEISPLQRSKLVRQRKRKTESVEAVTSSPYKQKQLDEKKTQQKGNDKQ